MSVDKERQTFEKLNRARDKDSFSQDNEEVDQQFIANPKPLSHDELSQLASRLQAMVRGQQLKTEQAIQQTLQQASIALQNAQKTETMMEQVQALQQAATQQGHANNAQFYQQLLQQLGKTIHEQMHQSDQQIAQSLQQAVASFTQSQAAMFDSQAFSNMAEILKQCEQTIKSWENQNGQTVH